MQRLAAILHLFLALLLLSSTTGLVVSEHYCQGQRVEIALFHHAKGCGMEKTGQAANCKLPASNTPYQQIDQSQCCYDHIQLLRSETNQNQTQQHYLSQNTAPITPLVGLLPSYLSQSLYASAKPLHLPKGPPPPTPLSKHTFPFLQSFLF